MNEVDIIWDITNMCGWTCEVCCVNAKHVKREGDRVFVALAGLRGYVEVEDDGLGGNDFDRALRYLQRTGRELTLEGKLAVLDNLAGMKAKIDLSGGDPLCAAENLLVLRETARRLGREQVTLTATGAGLGSLRAQDVAPFVSEMNFTFDSVPEFVANTRPKAYAKSNLTKAARLVKAGIRMRAECPLSIHNCSPEVLRPLYTSLHNAGVQTLLLMRLFNVGRGAQRRADIPTPEQYMNAIATIRELEAELGLPRVRLQCALRFFGDGGAAINPCDLMKPSFGLMPDGTLLASAWAVRLDGEPLNEAWILGNLAKSPLPEILATERARAYTSRLDENFGHCKIFAALNSQRANPADRIFDSSDPLALAMSEASRMETA